MLLTCVASVYGVGELGATAWDPNTTEPPGLVRSLVTGTPLSRELLLASLSSEKRLMSQRLVEAAVLAIMSTFTLLLCGGCAHCEDRRSTAGCSLLLSPLSGQAGLGRELSLAQLQLSERRPDQSTTQRIHRGTRGNM